MKTVPLRVLTLVLLAVVLAAAETLYEQDGVILDGSVRLAARAAATCVAAPEADEATKANAGQPLHVWRLDYRFGEPSGPTEVEHARAEPEPPPEVPVVIEPVCTDSSEHCWLQLDKSPGCHIWLGSFDGSLAGSDEWTGECPDGIASGTGSLLMGYNSRDGKTPSSTGRLEKGRRSGHWVVDWGDDVDEGPCVDGDRHGFWIYRTATGVRIQSRFVRGRQYDRRTLR